MQAGNLKAMDKLKTKYEKEAKLFVEESKKISAQERTEDKFEI